MFILNNSDGSFSPVFAKEIQKGIEFLNEVKPGWRDEIDPAVLDLADTTTCVCGQVFENHYTEGLAALSKYTGVDQADDQDASEYGFCVSVQDSKDWLAALGKSEDSEYEEQTNFLFSALTEEWINVLKMEREAKAVFDRMTKRMADLVT